MRVAIVHDWFVGGGAERVVYELHKMYPNAPIFTAYCSDEWRTKLASTQIVTSYMQHWPFSKIRKFLPPLRALWFSRLDFRDYDLVISSSGAEAKGIRVERQQWQMAFGKIIGKWQMKNERSDVKSPIHISYIHAPTHYYWARYEDYLEQPGFGVFNWLARLGLRLLIGPMRRWDFKAAQRPQYLIANSHYTKDQIKKCYKREATVIHPPVDVDRFKLPTTNRQLPPRSGFITAGRQTPYKRIDLAVTACSMLNLPLKVIGSGPDHKKLTKIAGPSVAFLEQVSDEAMPKFLGQAKAFIFPGIDDFGIVAVEALAAGTPVIAAGYGGALDYITKETGILFKPQSEQALVKALEEFENKHFDSRIIAKAAQNYSLDDFRLSFRSFVKDVGKEA
ncbi:MAG: glycosyltransferase [Candidatus Saccharimonadales bacterium]